MESNAHRIMILKQATVECNPMINRRSGRKAAVIYEDEIDVVLTRIEELEAFEEKYKHITAREKRHETKNNTEI